MNLFFYIIPNLDLTKKGKLSEYNIVKPRTFRSQDDNVEISYVKDVNVKNEEIEITLKKILVKNKDDIIYIFWVNNKNEIIIGALENKIKKTFYRDLGINEKLAFKEIFEEIEGVQFAKTTP